MTETKTSESEAPPTGMTDDAIRANGTVLIVDDDPALRLLCTKILGTKGIEAKTASGGDEAIRLASSEKFRIILLDLKMPGMDGLECLKRLKADGCRADIVMVTGYGNVPTAVEAMKVGARDFIEKPFMPQDLVSMIEDILLSQIRDADLFDDPVVGYIQQHATEIGSRKDVATRLGVSLERVSNRVQEVTSRSFRQFLHTCRLDLAKKLLHTTELDISQVSERTGFQTVQHFSRVFSERQGISPKNYRLQSRASS